MTEPDSENPTDLPAAPEESPDPSQSATVGAVASPIAPSIQITRVVGSLMIANGLIWIATVLLSGWPGLIHVVSGGPSVPTLIVYGGSGKPLIFQFHEYWRLISAMFLHIGALHITFNMISLMIYGPSLERGYGKGRFILLYVASGIGGSLLSAQLSTATVGAGASGAIFGLIGALIGMLIRHRASSSMVRQMAWMAGLLFIAGLQPGAAVDNWAHAGGFITGFIFCLLVPPPSSTPGPFSRAFNTLCAIMALSLIGWGLGSAAVNTWVHLRPNDLPLTTSPSAHGSFSLQIPVGWTPLNDPNWDIWRGPEGVVLFARELSSQETALLTQRGTVVSTVDIAESFFQSVPRNEFKVAVHQTRSFESRPFEEVTLSIPLSEGPRMTFTVFWIKTKDRAILLTGLTPDDLVWTRPLLQRIASTIQAK